MHVAKKKTKRTQTFYSGEQKVHAMLKSKLIEKDPFPKRKKSKRLNQSSYRSKWKVHSNTANEFLS